MFQAAEVPAAAYHPIEPEEVCYPCTLCQRCCCAFQESLETTEGRRRLLLNCLATLVVVILLRGPLLAILGPVGKVFEWILKPLLFVDEVIPPQVLEVVLVVTLGGTLTYLCYKKPDVACPVVLLVLLVGGYWFLSATIWYRPIDAAEDFAIGNVTLIT
mmetsp:Transcript_12720/g.28052  ORF Transcript_12720/g.28052 Transcript_12720/m.28052 type:complete len:159 (+) Transcript_12720:66-542(+)